MPNNTDAYTKAKHNKQLIKPLFTCFGTYTGNTRQKKKGKRTNWKVDIASLHTNKYQQHYSLCIEPSKYKPSTTGNHLFRGLRIFFSEKTGIGTSKSCKTFATTSRNKREEEASKLEAAIERYRYNK